MAIRSAAPAPHRQIHPASCAHFFSIDSNTQRSHVPLPQTTTWWSSFSFSFFFHSLFSLNQSKWLLVCFKHGQRNCRRQATRYSVENETKYTRASRAHIHMEIARRTALYKLYATYESNTALPTSAVCCFSILQPLSWFWLQSKFSLLCKRFEWTSCVCRRRRRYRYRGVISSLMFKYVYGICEFQLYVDSIRFLAP